MKNYPWREATSEEADLLRALLSENGVEPLTVKRQMGYMVCFRRQPDGSFLIETLGYCDPVLQRPKNGRRAYGKRKLDLCDCRQVKVRKCLGLRSETLEHWFISTGYHERQCPHCRQIASRKREWVPHQTARSTARRGC